MRARDFLTEGLNHPVIVVDVQPAYITPQNQHIMTNIVSFVQKQTGPVLMFVNAEQEGMTDDTMYDIQSWWEETVGEPVEVDDDEEYYFGKSQPSAIDWDRFELVDKGYGWFRAYMDQGVPNATMIKMIRHLYQHRLHDARQLDYDDYVAIMGSDRLIDENFSINWTSVAQLKRFSGAYIVGGGREECLREVELLMNAFNIRYKRIDSLVY